MVSSACLTLKTSCISVWPTAQKICDHNIIMAPSCVSSTLQDCGAVSMDSTGKDISSSIIAVDVTPCSTNDVCPACDISFAAAGLCLPGAYLYLYRYCLSLPHTKATPVSHVHLAEGPRPGRHPICTVGMCIMLCVCHNALSILVDGYGLPDAAQSPGQLCSAGINLTTGAGASSPALISPISLSANLIIHISNVKLKRAMLRQHQSG